MLDFVGIKTFPNIEFRLLIRSWSAYPFELLLPRVGFCLRAIIRNRILEFGKKYVRLELG